MPSTRWPSLSLRRTKGEGEAPGAVAQATEADFSRLLIRLSKTNLLFRPLDATGNLAASLDAILPMETDAPFHHFMIRHCLTHKMQPVLEAYSIWYGMHKMSYDVFFPTYKKSAASAGYGAERDRDSLCVCVLKLVGEVAEVLRVREHKTGPK